MKFTELLEADRRTEEKPLDCILERLEKTDDDKPAGGCTLERPDKCPADPVDG